MCAVPAFGSCSHTQLIKKNLLNFLLINIFVVVNQILWELMHLSENLKCFNTFLYVLMYVLCMFVFFIHHLQFFD